MSTITEEDLRNMSVAVLVSSKQLFLKKNLKNFLILGILSLFGSFMMLLSFFLFKSYKKQRNRMVIFGVFTYQKLLNI